MENAPRPLVSVIVPVYNTARYLPQCLSSLCAQTLHDIEILCINDGSTDASEDIIRVDHDFYERLYAAACREQADIAVTCAIFPFDDAGTIFPQKESAYVHEKVISTAEERSRLFLATGVLWNKLYSNELCRKVAALYSVTASATEDNAFSIPCHILAQKIVLVTQPRYFYRQHGASICHQKVEIATIQKSYEMGNLEEYDQDIYNRYLHGEFDSADSIKMDDSMKYQTVGGRTVYGGGGIMPDIFIPRDTSGVTSYFSNVINSGVLYLYTLEYSDRHRDQFSKFDNWEELYKYLQSQPLLEDFTNFAATKGIKKRPTLIRISGSLIENQIQAYIVRNFFDEAGFYPIFLKDDVTMLKAIEILKEGKSFPLQNTQQVTNGNLRSEAGLTKRYGLAKEIIFEDYIVRAIG